MRLSDCTKAELLELLEALQSPSLGNEHLSFASKYYIERYLNVLSDKRYDKVWKEYLQVQDEIQKWLPKYLDLNSNRRTVLHMEELVARRDRLAMKLKKLTNE